MHIRGTKKLETFWLRDSNVKSALQNFIYQVRNHDWSAPHELLADFPRASIIGGDRVVFRIRGNRYRLIASVDYERQILYIRFIGTHSEYDRIDATRV